jgi:transcriptional regulator with XRE-family HTH domain
MGVRLDVEYVRSEMAKQVISQSELAARAIRDDTGEPLSKQMISDILAGKRAPSPATVRALALALDVLPRKLLTDVVDAPHSAGSRSDGEQVPA